MGEFFHRLRLVILTICFCTTFSPSIGYADLTSLDTKILGSDGKLDVGDQYIEIGQFSFSHNETDPAVLTEILFQNHGSATLPDHFKNISLTDVSTGQISHATEVTDETLKFTFGSDGYTLPGGKTVTLSIRADIYFGTAPDTTSLQFVKIIDKNVGEIGYSCPSSGICGRLKTYTIDAGDFLLSRHPHAKGDQRVKPGDQVSFLSTAIYTPQPITVEELHVRLFNDTTAADKDDTNHDRNNIDDFQKTFGNLTLNVDGQDIPGGTFQLLSGGIDGTTEYYRIVFKTPFTTTSPLTTLSISGKVLSTAQNGDKLKLQLDEGSFQNPKYASDQTPLPAGSFNGTSATSSWVEVEDMSTLAPTLTLSSREATFIEIDSIVAGAYDVPMLSFLVQQEGGEAEVRINSVTLEAYGQGASSSQLDNLSFRLLNTQNPQNPIQQGSIQKRNSDGKIVFHDISIPAETPILVDVDTTEAMAGTADDESTFQIAVTQIKATDHHTQVSSELNLSPTSCFAHTDDMPKHPCGPRQRMVKSGILNVFFHMHSVALSSSQLEYSIIQKIDFSALDDDIQISDLYFYNENPDHDPAAEIFFELYSPNGTFLQRTTMKDRVLHFELPNSDRIVIPEKTTGTVTVKARYANPSPEEVQKSYWDLFPSWKYGIDGKGVQAYTADTGKLLTTEYVRFLDPHSNAASQAAAQNPPPAETKNDEASTEASPDPEKTEETTKDPTPDPTPDPDPTPEATTETTTEETTTETKSPEAFIDIDQSHRYHESITWAQKEKVVEGYTTDNGQKAFKADNPVKRIELLKIVIEALGINTEQVCRAYFAYNDVDWKAWYGNYLQIGSCLKIVKGYIKDGIISFKPGQTVTFVEAAKIIVEAMDIEVQAHEIWFEPYVQVLKAHNAVPPTIKTNAHEVTRAEMVYMMQKMMEENQS